MGGRLAAAAAAILAVMCPVKAAFYDTEIAHVGRKDVGVSGESVSVLASWSGAFS